MPTARLDLGSLKDFLSKMAENSNAVYWLSSPDLEKIIYISPAYEIIWGRKPEILYQHPEEWVTYIHPDDAREYRPILAMKERVKREGIKARYEEKYRIIRPDGETRYITDRGFPIVDPKTGECVGITGVAVDVTTEKKLEEERQKAHEELVAAHELKMKFIRDMQHDIRTPFSGIWGLANMLLKKETDPEKKELVQLIESASKQLLDYCNTILEFNKTESSPIMEEKLELKTILESVIDIEKPAAIVKRLELILETNNLPGFIFSDYARIKSLLINLVSNAIKFTDHGYVKLSVSQTRQFSENKILLQFRVEDTGIGIPIDKQRYIYEKFSRIEPSNTGKYTGTGLGLSIVKSIIYDLDGEIDVKSETDKGTVFTCNIPMRIPFLEK